MEGIGDQKLPPRYSNHSLLPAKSIPHITKPEQPEFSRDENLLLIPHSRNRDDLHSLHPSTHLLWINHTKSVRERPISKRVSFQQQSGSSLYPTTISREPATKESKPIAEPVPTDTKLQPLTYPLWHTIPSSKISKRSRSRRVFQRRVHRKKKIEKHNEDIQTKQLTYRLRQHCLQAYGLLANPSASLRSNFNSALINNTHPSLQPNNLSFHNLCQNRQLPIGTRQLLGLNLRFCLSSRNVNTSIKPTIFKIARSIRTKCYLKELNINNDTDYIKQIYKCNNNWNPPPAPLPLEDSITKFEKLVLESQQQLSSKIKRVRLTNLTPIQHNALRQLKNDKELIIKPTDKNLGPALMDRDTYIRQVLREHLLTDSYTQLSKNEATTRMESIKSTLENIFQTNQHLLSKPEITYFKRSFATRFRLPIFYGLPKVHKNPISLRPVVSSSNSLLSVFSIWLDYRMKDLLPLVDSYLKDSTTLINELKNIKLPETARIFTADAKSMYTNINTDAGLTAIENFLTVNKDKLPGDFPLDFFLSTLAIVMRNNIFSFADSFWLQLSGTAMGTPVACSYATVTFGHFENSTLLPLFKENLIYYRRYIDDIFGIWLPPTANKQSTWTAFKETLNSWSTLQWEVEELTTTTHFLDLNITMQDETLNFSTYQKPLNLYLYIPPLSAHPYSCFKGLVKGELHRYWRQNSPDNFQTLVIKFLERLMARGHTLENLYDIFTQAATTLDNLIMPPSPSNPDSGNTLYIHWAHHPNGLQRSDIRRIYNQTLQQNDIHDRMVVALSRPKNLRDVLTKTALTLREHTSIQDYINNL